MSTRGVSLCLVTWWLLFDSVLMRSDRARERTESNVSSAFVSTICDHRGLYFTLQVFIRQRDIRSRSLSFWRSFRSSRSRQVSIVHWQSTNASSLSHHQMSTVIDIDYLKTYLTACWHTITTWTRRHFRIRDSLLKCSSRSIYAPSSIVFIERAVRRNPSSVTWTHCTSLRSRTWHTDMHVCDLLGRSR